MENFGQSLSCGANYVPRLLDSYAIQLAEFLDQKEALIYKLQSKLIDFQEELAKEQHLAQHVRLAQY